VARVIEVSQSRDTGQAPVSGGPMSTVLRRQWDEHAMDWIQWVRAPGQPDSYFRFHREYFLSKVPAPGRLTLDVGCGEGRVGRDLRKAGHQVLGVDSSLTMCSAAATHDDTRYDPDGGRVISGDVAAMPLADGSVDCAIAFMCLQDMDNLAAAIQEIARVLEDGKRLVLAIVHPMYSHGRAPGIGQRRPAGPRYLEPELRVSTDRQDDLSVTFFREHRPIKSYMNALLDAGFVVDQLDEVTEPDETRPNHSVPMFLHIVATKKPRDARHLAGRRIRRRSAGDGALGHGNPSRRPAVPYLLRGVTFVPSGIADLSARWVAVLVLGGTLGSLTTLGLMALLRS
jgi:SAM-dependent methyltransferase